MANKYELILEKLEKEEKSLASFEKRITAYIIDLFIIWFACAIFLPFVIDKDTLIRLRELIYEYETIDPDNLYTTITISFVKFIVFLFIFQTVYYFICFYYCSATIGMYILKIKTIDNESLDSPNIISSFLKALIITMMSWILQGILFLFALANPLRMTFADMFSNTLVVNN